jgi:chromosomal replication initiator protein
MDPSHTVPAAVWKDVIGHVRLAHQHLARSWFGQLEPIGLERGSLLIGVANDAQGKYLEACCRPAFVEAVQAATGRLLSVEFRTLADLPDDGARETVVGAGSCIPLNGDYTFERFVTGPCNRLAHAATIAVSEDPGRAYNPLFVHGAVGLGKTHLLQAVCNAIVGRATGLRCSYISCETFTNEFIEAVERGLLYEFRYHYRGVDVLVIDDVQFLAERERSQEEFFHTFNTLAQSHKQIILSADCAPPEIPSLEERLVSRFSSGLVAVLEQPCLETRMAILRSKAKMRCIQVPDEVVRYVAEQVDTNIRNLEGSLTTIDALAQVEGAPISLDVARRALGGTRQQVVSIAMIMECIARRTGTRITDMQGKRRVQSVTHPRHVCMYLARELTSLSLEQIGGYFGGRDHSTVLHAHRRISRLRDREPKLQRLLKDATTELQNQAARAR